jgi:two-component sensor histidine kinase
MRLQNKLAIVVFILFLVAVIAGGLFYLLFAKYKKISRENAELVKEQSHRTKNNLQSVSDLLSLELHRLSDPVAVKAMEESLMRVEAMLLLHRGLYQGEKLIEVNLPKYLPDLVKSVLRSYHLEAVKVQYDIEPIWLHTDKAIPLGLIVNELTTNTCKYALKNNPDPQLMLHCFLQTDRLFLRFADNGPGFVSPADKNTFGLRLIGLLMNKLKAKGDFSTANGCCFELSFLTKAAPLNQPKSLKNQPV